ENPDCVLVGTWGRFIDIDGKELFISKLPVEDANIRKKMHLNNMFIHPSVMMRSDSLIKVGGYQGIYKSCEDYDLFFRLMSIGKVHNLPEVLINYEVNFLSISSLKR
ncbi:TPA: glycosyl transferase family 2, partial [Escherichia coli]